MEPTKCPVNMVFQHLVLILNMIVAENIAYGLKRQKAPGGERSKKIQSVLERIGLPISLLMQKNSFQFIQSC